MTDPALAAADAPDVAQRRRVLVAVGATALLALGGGGLVLLSGGGEAGTEVAAPAQRTRAAATPTPPPDPAPPTVPPPAQTPVSARNPYRPLYADTATGSASAGAAGAAAPTPTVSPTTPAVSPTTTATPAPVIPPPVVVPTTSVPTTVAPTTTPARYPLKLIRIRSSGNTALLTWTVDGKPLTTLDSQRFGLHGELVVLSITKSSKGALDVWVQAYAGTPFTIRVGQTRSVL